MEWLTTVVEVLPKLKTRLQLSGLVVVVAVVATRALAPQAANAQLSAGAIGVLFIVFGQVFSSLKDFPEHERSRLVLLLFVIFCVFIVSLVVITGIFVARADSRPVTDNRVPTGSTVLNQEAPQHLANLQLSQRQPSQRQPGSASPKDHQEVPHFGDDQASQSPPSEISKPHPDSKDNQERPPIAPSVIIWTENYQRLLDHLQTQDGCSIDDAAKIDESGLDDTLDRLDLSNETELQSIKAEITSMEKSHIATEAETRCFSAASGKQVNLRADILSKLRSLIRAVRKKALSEGIDVEAMEQKTEKLDSLLF